MATQPYLFFEGACEEALRFYHAAVGAEIEAIIRFKDAPEPPPPDTQPDRPGDKILHAAFKVGGTVVMATDGRCSGRPHFAGFGLALTLPDAAAVDRAFSALSAGGSIEMPPSKTFFSPRFGMVLDRFGVRWMVSAAP